MTSKNLIWLIFDSMRGDRTSIGGHKRDTTPTLEKIGSRSDGYAGTCFSHGIWSQPSVASMMTGTYLSRHGSGCHNQTLPEDIPTVADRLSKAGYRTVGLSSNPYFSPTTGTHRGFDRFDFISGKELIREAGVKNVFSFVRNLRTFSGGFKMDKRKHSPDFLLNKIAKARLQTYARLDSPFFFTAHYNGVHHPYYPSPVFRKQFASDLPVSPDQAAEVSFEQTTNVYSRIARGRFDDESTKNIIEAMYDAQIAQADALVDELISYIDSLGIGDETIIVVTSDHGDLLGEMGLFSHKLVLHDALIKVPLAVRGSDYLADSDIGLAQHADIMQTILTELGVETSGMQGHQLDRTTRKMVVSQRGAKTHQKTVEEVRKYDPEFNHKHAIPGFVTALRTEKWKFVSGDTDNLLYKLPFENEDTAESYPDVAEQFRSRLSEWMDKHGDTIEAAGNAEFDQKTRDLLEDLGYVVE